MTLGLILAIGYFVLGRLAFLTAVSDGSSTSVAFLSEGIALAFAILFGSRVCWGIFVGQFALTVSLGNPIALALAFGLINMVASISGGRLFWKWRISPSFQNPKDILRLLALSALVLQPFGACSRIVSQMFIIGANDLFHLSFHAWAGNVMGQILLVPPILVACCTGFKIKGPESRRSGAILAVYFSGLLTFCFFDLGDKESIYWIAIFGWFILAIIWNAMRSSPLVTALSNLLAATGFLWAIVASPDFSTQDRIMYADVLIFGGVVTSLIIASLFSQLRDLTLQLTRANHSKESILAMLGHDLRSPFADISIALDILREGRLRQNDFHSILEQLRLMTDQARFTCESVMEWAALQANEFKPSPANWTVKTIIWEAFELFRMKAEIKKIDVRIEVPEEAVAYVDRQHLGSIFRNLLSNAIKFTESGGRVTVSACREGNTWRFSVEDTGIGMQDQDLECIFGNERKIQFFKPYSQQPGAGIGLWIVAILVEANGGIIEGKSIKGKGTEFSFTFPVSSTFGRALQASATPLQANRSC